MGYEQRKHPRYSLDLPVTLTKDSETIDGRIVNVSLNGILIETKTELARFSPWTVRVGYGAPLRTVRCTGVVARIDKTNPNGFGIELTIQDNGLEELISFLGRGEVGRERFIAMKSEHKEG